MTSAWPKTRSDLDFKEDEVRMEKIMEAVRVIRNRRAEMNVPPTRKAAVIIYTEDQALFLTAVPFLKRLAFASQVSLIDSAPEDLTGMVSLVTNSARLYLPMSDLVDTEKELARLNKELDHVSGRIEMLESKLQNPGFVGKAPAQVVKAEQEKLAEANQLKAQLIDNIASLKRSGK